MDEKRCMKCQQDTAKLFSTSCGHIVCYNCVQMVLQKAFPGGTLLCPQCEYPLLVEGVGEKLGHDKKQLARLVSKGFEGLGVVATREIYKIMGQFDPMWDPDFFTTMPKTKKVWIVTP